MVWVHEIELLRQPDHALVVAQCTLESTEINWCYEFVSLLVAMATLPQPLFMSSRIWSLNAILTGGNSLRLMASVEKPSAFPISLCVSLYRV